MNLLEPEISSMASKSIQPKDHTMKSSSKSVQFNPLSESDFELLYHWFKEPTINYWYARNRFWSFEDIKQKYLPRLLGKDKTSSFIIYKNERPIGFIQYYFLTEHYPEGILNSNNPLFNQYNPNTLVGIDLFLASQHNRGKELGSLVIHDFIATLPRNTRAIIIDPSLTNHQAIRCYEKAGFEHTSYSEDRAYLLMLKILPGI